MPRATKKEKKEAAAKTYDQIAVLLDEAADLEVESRQLHAARDTALDEIHDQYNPQIDQVETRKAEIEKITELWGLAHESEYFAPRTLKFSRARLKLRLGTPRVKTRTKVTFADVTQRVLQMGRAAQERYLRFRDPEVNKDNIIADRKNTELLEKLGVRVVQNPKASIEYVIDDTDKPENAQ